MSAQPGWGLCVDPGFFADLKELPYQDSGATLKFSPPSVKGSLVPVELKLRSSTPVPAEVLTVVA